jgi:hypothetical protein
MILNWRNPKDHLQTKKDIVNELKENNIDVDILRELKSFYE